MRDRKACPPPACASSWQLPTRCAHHAACARIAPSQARGLSNRPRSHAPTNVAATQKYALHFLALVALDIGAHWAQMYASLLSRAASHKDVAAAKWALLRAYYSKRIFMGMLCVGAEVFYMVRTVCCSSACTAARKPPAAVSTHFHVARLADLAIASPPGSACCCCRTRSISLGRRPAWRCPPRCWLPRRRSSLRCFPAAP